MSSLASDFLIRAGACALAATVPGTLELTLLTLGSLRRSRQFNPGGYRLRLAVIIPAHNEAKLITRCVNSVTASARHSGYCQIVVVADNCTDNTEALAAATGARVIVRDNPELRGKGYALNLAFQQLEQDHLDAFLIVDADSVVSTNLIGEVKRALAGGAAAVQCRYRILDAGQSLRTRVMDLAFLAFNVMRPKGRSGWGLSAGILGNGFALSAEALRRAPWDAASIVEDLEYHLRLVTASQRVDFINAATVFGATPPGGRAARAQRLRWEGGRLRMAREWCPRLAAEILRGKWRSAEPLLDLLLLPLSYHVLLLGLAFLVLPNPLACYALAGLCLVAIHVAGAVLLGEHPLDSALALLASPFYIVWKMTTLRGTISASRRDASWVRTGRD